jgi:putative tricarboxylic transport membrane protein
VSSEGSTAGGRRRFALGESVIGAGVLVLAGVVYWQTAAIPISPVYARVGPTAVPTMTAIGLAVLGVLLLVEAARGGWQSQTERELTIDRTALSWIAAGLILNVLLIGPLGFTLASTILFVCVARAFGSRALVRDAAIAALFALIAYFGFARTLGINIGAGLVENAIEAALGIAPGA